MANTKISQFPQYSGLVNTDLYFLNNNSGETETTKIQLNQFQGLTQGEGPNTIQSNTYFGDLGTTASTENSIAIGNGAEATSPRSIAIGYLAYNVNRDGVRNDYISIGTEANCVQQSVSIGLRPNAGGQDSIAIGTDAAAYDNETVSIGHESRVYAQKTVGIGYFADVRSVGGVGIGNDVYSEGLGAIAIGENKEVVGNYSTNIGGYSNTLNSIYSTILGGSGNTITSLEHTAMIGCIGRTATTSGATFVENLVIFNYAALDFADDTAAAAAGVVLGQVYHNLGALRIRIT